MGFGKDGKGVIIKEAATQPLLTLASNTGLFLASGNVVGVLLKTRFRHLKVEYSAVISGAAVIDGDGPIDLYLVDGDLTVAEAEQAIEMAGPLSANDVVLAAQAMRWVKYMGQIWFVEQTANAENPHLRDAELQRVTRWTFGIDKGWRWFAYNTGSGALTTGATIKVTAKHFGVWVT